jgi:RNA polymerase sigma factor (TIGR02999 family)
MSQDITLLLKTIETGDAEAASDLMTRVYQELKHMAVGLMSAEAAAQITLQPTALVHEAWMKLVDAEGRSHFQNRAHFFGAAAEAMRRILVDRARRRLREKRGGKLVRVEFDATMIDRPEATDELLHVHDALDKLAAVDARKAELVKLRYFVGLTFEEIAALMSISVPTAHRDWAYARAWLRVEIGRA